MPNECSRNPTQSLHNAVKVMGLDCTHVSDRIKWNKRKSARIR